MRNMRVVPTIVAMVILAILLVGCGPSKEAIAFERLQKVDAAKTRAFQLFVDFISAASSGEAVGLRDRMNKELAAVGLDSDAIGVDSDILTQHLQKLYLKDASVAFGRLRRTHANIRQAESYKVLYEHCMEAAGKSVSPAMERRLALEIARNKIEEGRSGQRAHGVVAKKKRSSGRTTAKKLFPRVTNQSEFDSGFEVGPPKGKNKI